MTTVLSDGTFYHSWGERIDGSPYMACRGYGSFLPFWSEGKWELCSQRAAEKAGILPHAAIACFGFSFRDFDTREVSENVLDQELRRLHRRILGPWDRLDLEGGLSCPQSEDRLAWDLYTTGKSRLVWSFRRAPWGSWEKRWVWYCARQKAWLPLQIILGGIRLKECSGCDHGAFAYLPSAKFGARKYPLSDQPCAVKLAPGYGYRFFPDYLTEYGSDKWLAHLKWLNQKLQENGCKEIKPFSVLKIENRKGEDMSKELKKANETSMTVRIMPKTTREMEMRVLGDLEATAGDNQLSAVQRLQQTAQAVRCLIGLRQIEARIAMLEQTGKQVKPLIFGK